MMEWPLIVVNKTFYSLEEPNQDSQTPTRTIRRIKTLTLAIDQASMKLHVHGPILDLVTRQIIQYQAAQTPPFRFPFSYDIYFQKNHTNK